MYNNCKDCRYKRHVELMASFDDEDGNDIQKQDSNDRYVIPTDVWDGKILCPHYFNMHTD